MRICIIMMLKDEDELAMTWVKYHGAVVGYENLFIFDNGSTQAGTIAAIDHAESKGSRVDRGQSGFLAFKHKGMTFEALIKRLDQESPYDFYFPLDIDEFLSARLSHRYAVTPTEIFSVLSKYLESPDALMIRGAPTNHPLKPSWYDPSEGQRKFFFARGACVKLDHGFHHGITKSGKTLVTDMVYFHFHFRPFRDQQAAARKKLEGFVTDFDRETIRSHQEKKGSGFHLVQYLLQTESQYYAEFDKRTLIYIPEFSKSLDAFSLDLPYLKTRLEEIALTPDQEDARISTVNDADQLAACLDRSAGSLDRLFKLYKRIGATARVEQTAEAILASNPANFLVRRDLIHLAVERGLVSQTKSTAWSEARYHLSEAEKQESVAAEDLIYIARYNSRIGDHEVGLRNIQKAIMMLEGDEKLAARLVQAEIYVENKDKSRAIKELEDITPKLHRPNQLIRCALMMGKLGMAKSSLAEGRRSIGVLRPARTTPQDYLQLAKLFIRNGAAADAKIVMIKAGFTNFPQMNLLVEFHEVNFELDLKELAKQYAEAALAKDAYHPLMVERLGILQLLERTPKPVAEPLAPPVTGKGIGVMRMFTGIRRRG